MSTQTQYSNYYVWCEKHPQQAQLLTNPFFFRHPCRLEKHQDDPDIDEPISGSSGNVLSSTVASSSSAAATTAEGSGQSSTAGGGEGEDTEERGKPSIHLLAKQHPPIPCCLLFCLSQKTHTHTTVGFPVTLTIVSFNNNTIHTTFLEGDVIQDGDQTPQSLVCQDCGMILRNGKTDKGEGGEGPPYPPVLFFLLWLL